MSLINVFHSKPARAGIGVVTVALGTFAFPYVLEILSNLVKAIPGCKEGLNILSLMVFSPFYVAAACALFFAAEALRARTTLRQGLKQFIGIVFLWAAIGVLISFIGVVVMTAATGSAQGPLAFIFYGPASIAIGALVGAAMWRLMELTP